MAFVSAPVGGGVRVGTTVGGGGGGGFGGGVVSFLFICVLIFLVTEYWWIFAIIGGIIIVVIGFIIWCGTHPLPPEEVQAYYERKRDRERRYPDLPDARK